MRLPLLLLAAAAAPLAAQIPADLTAERASLIDWLAKAPVSPATVVALTPISPDQTIVVGPASADLPIPGFDSALVRMSKGLITLESKHGSEPVPQAGTLKYGTFLIAQAGSASRRSVLIYGAVRQPLKPEWYPYAPPLVFTVSLEKPDRSETRTLLDFDGVEAPAALAGFVSLTVEGKPYRLRVYRFGGGDDEESSLEVYFQDATNDNGSYPAGRFVELKPVAGGRYQLDFNRARNPFCAYRTVYPCPIPWSGNLINAPITAGERYVHAKAGG
ncbi:MAG TPA: DUF1684 domain-containing protein [Gemmatimonadales bacterium]|nr:DUF1684 domain-containing protein [Gemmatimonadales bacterium]